MSHVLAGVLLQGGGSSCGGHGGESGTCEVVAQAVSDSLPLITHTQTPEAQLITHARNYLLVWIVCVCMHVCIHACMYV